MKSRHQEQRRVASLALEAAGERRVTDVKSVIAETSSSSCPSPDPRG